MINYFIHSLKNTFNFTDRARRAEYAWFSLYSKLLIVVCSLILSITLLFLSMAVDGHSLLFKIILTTGFILLAALGIWLTIAGISIDVRRLHDIGQSGWWALLRLVAILIPFIGFMLVFGSWIYLLSKEGDQGKNLYGADPKQEKKSK